MNDDGTAEPRRDTTESPGWHSESINSERKLRRGTPRGALAPWAREMADAPRW